MAKGVTYAVPAYDESVDVVRDFKKLADASITSILLVEDSNTRSKDITIELLDNKKVFTFDDTNTDTPVVTIVEDLPVGFQFTIVTGPNVEVSIVVDPSERLLGGNGVAPESVAIATKIADNAWIVVAGGDGGYLVQQEAFTFKKSKLGEGDYYG